MTLHDTLTIVKLTGTVKDGHIVLDGAPLLPEGTPVTITVDERDLPPGPYVQLDENGDLVMTPELEAELDEAAATSWEDCSPLEEVLARIAPTR